MMTPKYYYLDSQDKYFNMLKCQVLRTDIVMDVGQSLNPGIDIGQIEGGFMQGYGHLTMEEVRYSTDGHKLTKGPSSYKIPAFSDVPVELNVSLLKGSRNTKAVYSSKVRTAVQRYEFNKYKQSKNKMINPKKS